jgi:TolB protein
LAVALLLAVVGSAAGHAGYRQRTGSIAFLRMPAATALRVFAPALFVIRADGSGLRRLTPRGTSAWDYQWSPDGKLIAYIDARTASLWLVHPDGTGRRLLLPGSLLSSGGLSWSPDGKEIAIVSPGPDVSPRQIECGGEMGLYVVPIGAGGPVVVSPARRGVGCGVAWSPLGNEIAYEDVSGIRVVSPDGGGSRRILSRGRDPQWSFDGTKLAVPTLRHLGQHRVVLYHQITVVNADGSDPHVVTNYADTEYPFAWSPDSRQILYGRQDQEGIYVIGADGRGNHRVTRDSPRGADWDALGWSPHGSSIVYATDRTGNGDLYIITANGHNEVRLTNTPDFDLAPSWAPQ